MSGPKQGTAKPEERPKRVFLRFQWLPHHTSGKDMLRPYASHAIPEFTKNRDAWSVFVSAREVEKAIRELERVCYCCDEGNPHEQCTCFEVGKSKQVAAEMLQELVNL